MLHTAGVNTYADKKKEICEYRQANNFFFQVLPVEETWQHNAQLQPVVETSLYMIKLMSANRVECKMAMTSKLNVLHR